MDVFGMPVDFWHKALGLLMHLIPTGIVLVVLWIVWRREWIGAILFPLLAVLHLVTKWGQLNWAGYAGIDGPLVLLGILFFVNWRMRATLRPNTEQSWFGSDTHTNRLPTGHPLGWTAF